MNPSRRLRIFLVALVATAFAGSQPTYAAAPSARGGQSGLLKGASHPGPSEDEGQEAIVGTWITNVTALGDDAPPPFPSLLTINEGGTAMFSAAGPPIPALGNPGHGVWTKLGRRRYAATFVQLTFGPDLQLNGSLKLSLVITLDGNTITTVDQATIYDLDGNEIVTLSGTEAGKRLKVDVIR